MFQHSTNTVDDLDDLEQLRIAALQTLHQKKTEPRPVITTPQVHHYPDVKTFVDDDPLSSFPGYNNTRIQLSPRSAAFVESNMTILKRRKEGLDDRWSRSPSPPKYKSAKRKSLSPIRRSTPPSVAPERKDRHVKRVSRSPPPKHSAHQNHIRRSDTHHRSSHNSSKDSKRHRPRSRDRVVSDRNGSRHRSTERQRSSDRHRTSHRMNENRPKTRSKSPLQSRHHRDDRGERRGRKRSSEPREENEKMIKKSKDAEQAKEDRKLKEVQDKPVEEEKKSPETETEESPKEEDNEDSDSSDSDSSPSEAIDLFASDDSESENEGRFKCSSRSTDDKKTTFSSKPKKANLADTVLPDGDGRMDGDRGRFGNRRRMDDRRDRKGGSFKPSFRENDSDKYARRTTHSSRREDRERDRDRDHDGPREKVRSSVNVVSSSRKGSSEKL